MKSVILKAILPAAEGTRVLIPRVDNLMTLRGESANVRIRA